MSKKSDDKKTVLIVGGGSAGSAIARDLSGKLDPSKVNLLVVTANPYSIFLPATLRMTVSAEDKLEDKALIPYDKLFINGNGSVIVGTVVGIEADAASGRGVVTLKDGQKLPYDYLALTQGSIWKGPAAFPEGDVSAYVKEWQSKYAKAKDVVIVGGGAVGIEIAGEIKQYYPETKVTVVQGSNALANDAYPIKFRKALDVGLKAKGVTIVYNDYVDDIPADGLTTAGEVTTRNGKKISADLVIDARGPRPNTSIVSALGSDVLTPTGHIKVKPTLQLPSYPTIFAAGDVIEWKEQSQAVKAGGHAAVVAANILSLSKGEQAVKEYKGSMEMILVTNGKTGGAAYIGILWGILLGDFFARLLKSKDLLVPYARKALGQTA